MVVHTSYKKHILYLPAIYYSVIRKSGVVKGKCVVGLIRRADITFLTPLQRGYFHTEIK